MGTAGAHALPDGSAGGGPADAAAGTDGPRRRARTRSGSRARRPGKVHPPAGAVPARGPGGGRHQPDLPLPGPGAVRRERCGRLLRAGAAGGYLPRRPGRARRAGRGRGVRQWQVLTGARRHRGLPRAQRTGGGRHLARSAPDDGTREPPSVRIAARGRPGRGSLHDVRRPGRAHGVLCSAGRPGVERRAGPRPPSGPDGRRTRSPRPLPPGGGRSPPAGGDERGGAALRHRRAGPAGRPVARARVGGPAGPGRGGRAGRPAAALPRHPGDLVTT